MEGLHQRASTKELAPVRKKLHFSNAFISNKARNTRLRSNRLQVAVGIWCVLCASLSTLLFTYTFKATVEQRRKLENGSPINVDRDNDPFDRVARSRDILNANSAAQGTAHASRPSWKAIIKKPFLVATKHPGNTNKNEEPIKSLETKASNPMPTEASLPLPDYLRIPDDEPVVQVINTRFMQHQPQLVELGLARLELLKTICLPTLLQQTSQNFLWIVRVDPDLNEVVKKSLLEVIQKATHNSTLHVVVISSNDNPTGFRRELEDQPNQVWTDNYSLLQHFHEAAQSRIVLETRLDADDGLHILFVEIIQEDAVKYLGMEKNWLVWCAGTHVEWQYGTPWDDWPHHNAKGKGTQQEIEKADSSYGSLLPGLTRGCITPGLTKGYGKDVAFEEVPEAQHHQLHWQMKRCNMDVEENWEHCLVIWKRIVPTAIRGRTPTSAGMQFVLGNHISYLSKESRNALGLDDNTMLDKQDMMWNSVIQRFEITKESIRDMRNYLTEHMHGIALDNLEGQCTKGHSCKNSSQEILQHLVEDTSAEAVNSTGAMGISHTQETQ